MLDTIIGFAPNWNTASSHNAGISIYISPGKINGVTYAPGVQNVLAAINSNGLLYNQQTTYFWLQSNGAVNQGPGMPESGVFPLAAVTIDNVITGSGNGQYIIPQNSLSNFQSAPPLGLELSFIYFSQQVQAPGVVEIEDLRPLGEFSFA